MATEQTAQDKAREAFEKQARFMKVEWSLEWNSTGFYSDLNADRAFTWFELGFAQARLSTNDSPMPSTSLGGDDVVTFDRAKLITAIDAVDAGLSDTKRTMKTDKKLQLYEAAYELVLLG